MKSSVEGSVSRTIAQWRAIARTALARDMPPSQLAWRDDGTASHLFGDDIAPSEPALVGASVPRQFVALDRKSVV